jgi:hypothetical protein
MFDERALWPRPRTLRRTPEHVVAVHCLGLTCYTRDCTASAAADLLALFLGMPASRSLSRYRTSVMPGWRPFSRDESGALLDGLRGGWTGISARHLFGLEIADQRGAPSAFFRYREIEASRGAGTGYFQVGAPVTTEPDDLLQLAVAAAQTIPMWWGVGGHCASIDPDRRVTALSSVHA